MGNEIDQECEQAGGSTRKPDTLRHRQIRILDSSVAKVEVVVPCLTADDSLPAYTHAPSRRLRVQNGAENGGGQELAAGWKVKIRYLPESSAAGDGCGTGFEDWLATRSVETF
jgi:nitrogen fixation protein